MAGRGNGSALWVKGWGRLEEEVSDRSWGRLGEVWGTGINRTLRNEEAGKMGRGFPGEGEAERGLGVERAENASGSEVTRD